MANHKLKQTLANFSKLNRVCHSLLEFAKEFAKVCLGLPKFEGLISLHIRAKGHSPARHV